MTHDAAGYEDDEFDDEEFVGELRTTRLSYVALGVALAAVLLSIVPYTGGVLALVALVLCVIEGLRFDISKTVVKISAVVAVVAILANLFFTSLSWYGDALSGLGAFDVVA